METESFQPVHYPVMYREIIQVYREFLGEVTEGSLHFLDGTGGEAGHVLEVLRTFPNSKILFLDRDPEMLERANQRIQESGILNFRDRVFSLRKNYSDLIWQDLVDLGFSEGLDGILLDLGISTYHILESGRGFSFRGKESLDMRLDPSPSARQVSASEIVNSYPPKELERIFYEYGEERWTKKIVGRILEKRVHKSFDSNHDLAKLVEGTIPRKFWPPKSHPAVRVFQALRIEVNQELAHLEAAVRNLPKLLRMGGVMQVISFHSLEDRIVKHSFKDLVQTNSEPEHFYQLLTKKPILPSESEIQENSPSRSAKLRVIQRVKEISKKGKYGQ
jgi:16S rRNA (cytosine1402-N4)-methyltransferase